MWNQIKKYVPFLAIAGYLLLYLNKGFDRVLIDLKGITIDKLMAKWQNIAVAIVAAVLIYVVTNLKMPVAFKTIVLGALYLIIGYNIAVAIDPPAPGARYVVPKAANPYAHAAQGR
jgi:hypothetical protein